jgi:hypothetical protein
VFDISAMLTVDVHQESGLKLVYAFVIIIIN